MTALHAASALVLMLVAAVAAAADDAGSKVAPEEMGLSKTSVFEVPTPEPPSYPSAPPGTVEPLGRAYPSAPPQIPHDISPFLPVTLKNNACRQCHDVPHRIGQPKNPYQPTPIPESHYTDLRRAPGEVTQQLIGARFVCTQCHVPQAEAAPLVENLFGPPADRAGQ